MARGRPGSWYVRRALEGSSGIARLSAAIVAAAMPVAAVGCGGAKGQDAKEPSGRYPVEVVKASWTVRQRLSQHTQMRLVIRNAGSKTIPDIAVTIGGKGAGGSTGTSSGAFEESGPINTVNSNLANPSRPVWIVDAGPNRNGRTEGQPARGLPNTAYVNTWALGPLAPGRTATFVWSLTSVKPGRHVVRWQVAAGLNGKAVAVRADGSRPRGQFDVFIDRAPLRQGVGPNGQKITLPSG